MVTSHHSGTEWDPGRPMAQQSRWAEHASFMNGLVDAGFVILGGPLDAFRVVLLVTGDSEQAVRDTLAADPWYGSHLRLYTIDPIDLLLDSRG